MTLAVCKPQVLIFGTKTVSVFADWLTLQSWLPRSMLYPDPYLLGALAAVVGEKRETVGFWLVVATIKIATVTREFPPDT